MNMQYSNIGLALTERSEGVRLRAYQDQGGVWTIGYGHTGAGAYFGAVITPEQAETYLIQDVQKAVAAVNASVTAPVTQYQFDALVDFTFNVGTHAFENSTLLKHLNAGNMPAAEADFRSWVFVGGKVNPGLLNRRLAEQAVFEEV